MFFLVKRAGTVQPSLFLPKFSLFFLAHCRKWRVLKSSRALPLRTSTATPRHSGQNWTGCYTTSPWSMHRWCWEGRRSIIFPSAVTMAGRLSYLMIWRKQCLPTDGAKSPRWAGTVCIFVRSVPVKTALRINQVLSRVVSPPLTAVYAQNKAKIWFILEECTKESNK